MTKDRLDRRAPALMAWVSGAAVAVLLARLYAETGRQLIGQWSHDPDYAHGFLVLPLACYFVWERRAVLAQLSVTPSPWGAALLGIGLVQLMLGVVGAELFLQRTSLIVVVAGLVLLVLGRRFLEALLFPIAFLAFMVPLPAIVMNSVAFPLQLFAARAATFCLYNVGIPVLREGNVIVLAHTRLEGRRGLQRHPIPPGPHLSQRGLWPYDRQTDLAEVAAAGHFGADCRRRQRAPRDGDGRAGAVHRRGGGPGLLPPVRGVVRVPGGPGPPRGVRNPDLTCGRPFGGTADAGGPRMKAWSWGAAVFLLATANFALAWVSRPEPAKVRPPLRDLPLRVGERWEGREVDLDARTLEVLQLTDHVMRAYVPRTAGSPDGARAAGSIEGTPKHGIAPVYLYVGYYDDQRTGATYHSPKNCLPGSGWQITESGTTDVSVAGGRFAVNSVVIEKGFDRQLVLYWYQDRGRSIASEYSAKFFLIRDAVVRNRTDGALVRISTPIVETREDADLHAVRFLEDVWPLLLARLPA